MSPMKRASTLILPESGNTVGQAFSAESEVGESLNDVGIRYDIGIIEMQRANPKIPATSILSVGTKLRIPATFTLPRSRQGIIINLAQFRLYYFPQNDNIVITAPIGIGRKGWETPLGVTSIISKEINPTWHPSQQLINYANAHGTLLPDKFPGGKHSPLGKYVLRLGWPSYLIHGSNKSNAIGRRVSAGCIRLLTKDIEELYDLVPLGTRVQIISS